MAATAPLRDTAAEVLQTLFRTYDFEGTQLPPARAVLNRPREVVAPQTVQEFADAVESRVPKMFGSTSHMQRVLVVGDDELPPNVGAAYREQNGGEMIWRDSSKRTMERFLSGTYRSNLYPAEQLSFLSQLKLELAIFFHEAIHSQGVASDSQFVKNMSMDEGDERVLAFSEGLTNAVAQTFLDEFITTMGLDLVDSRLRDVQLPRQLGAYVGPTEAMFVVMMAAAARTAGQDEIAKLQSVLQQVGRTGEQFDVAARRLGFELADLPVFRQTMTRAVQGGNGEPTLVDVSRELLTGTGRENDESAVMQLANVIADELFTSRKEFERGGGSFESMRLQGVRHGLTILDAAKQIGGSVQHPADAWRPAVPRRDPWSTPRRRAPVIVPIAPGYAVALEV